MLPKIKIKAFRAIDDIKACQKFIEGHRRVLDIFGVDKVTSANHEWAQNPAVFVILVESLDEEKVYGGARIHAVGGTQPLPIEEATGDMDSRIYNVVKQYSKEGCGELCGLWNSREVAGLGIGAFFSTRAGVVISEQIGLKYLFALCAPYTVKFSEWVGCKILTSIGNNGTFYYPKIDLLATVVLLEDTQKLESANPMEREKIFLLRKNLTQVISEKAPIRDIVVEINYNLKVAGANPNEFKHI